MRCVRNVAVAAALALACAAAHAAASCKLLKIADWEVRPESGRLIVAGAINGQKVGILLDTGAQTSFVTRAAADRLGLTRQEAKGYRAYGVGGETYVEYAVIQELKIGNAARRNWRTFVLGERDLGRQFAFLLGYDFFDQVDVEFDLANNAVRIFQPQDCSDVSLAYWARGGAGTAKLEVDNEKPGILVGVKLNGTPLVAQIDSGARASVVSRRVAASLGVGLESGNATPAGKASGLGARRPDNWIGAFESFSIGDEVIRNPNIQFTNLEVSTTETGSHMTTQVELREMLLGVDFLRAHRVFVSHSQRKVYFTYAGGQVFSASRTEADLPRPAPTADAPRSAPDASRCLTPTC